VVLGVVVPAHDGGGREGILVSSMLVEKGAISLYTVLDSLCVCVRRVCVVWGLSQSVRFRLVWCVCDLTFWSC